MLRVFTNDSLEYAAASGVGDFMLEDGGIQFFSNRNIKITVVTSNI
jgi:hypothetical protein